MDRGSTHLGILLPATIYYHLRPILSRYSLCAFVVFYLFFHTGFFHLARFLKNSK